MGKYTGNQKTSKPQYSKILKVLRQVNLIFMISTVVNNYIEYKNTGCLQSGSVSVVSICCNNMKRENKLFIMHYYYCYYCRY